jgi:DNA-binding NarL/FixJ family response regulator
MLIAGVMADVGLNVEYATTGDEALTMAERAAPSVVILALDLPNPCGYEVLFRLRSQHGQSVAIGVLSACGDAPPRDEVAAFLLGADDYFGRPLHPDLVLARVRRLLAVPRPVALRGHTRDSGSRSRGSRDAALACLTPREHEVLSLLVNGRPRIEIADLLCITRKTVSTHIERILVKLGAHSQAQAIAFAIRDGVVETGAGAALPA